MPRKRREISKRTGWGCGKSWGESRRSTGWQGVAPTKSGMRSGNFGGQGGGSFGWVQGKMCRSKTERKSVREINHSKAAKIRADKKRQGRGEVSQEKRKNYEGTRDKAISQNGSGGEEYIGKALWGYRWRRTIHGVRMVDIKTLECTEAKWEPTDSGRKKDRDRRVRWTRHPGGRRKKGGTCGRNCGEDLLKSRDALIPQSRKKMWVHEDRRKRPTRGPQDFACGVFRDPSMIISRKKTKIVAYPDLKEVRGKATCTRKKP